MRLIKILSLVLVVGLTMGASVTSTASAASARLTLSQGGVPLPPGEQLEVFGKNNLSVRDSLANIECPGQPVDAGFLLEVATNSKTLDQANLVASGDGLFDGGHCRAERFGAAVISIIQSRPLKLRATGKATVTAIVFRMLLEQNDVECFFKGTLKGSNNATPVKEPLEIGFSGQKLNRDNAFANSNLCPKSAEMTVSFDMSRTEEVEEPIEEQLT
jgi:hypothetical protein